MIQRDSRTLTLPRWPWRAILLTCCLMTGMAGCGTDGPVRYPVSGKIEYNGQPVRAGYIVFEPDAAQGNQGPAGRATIARGHYKTDVDRGIVGGPTILRIHATDGVPYTIEEEGEVVEQGRPLFAEHIEHVAFPLEAVVHDLRINSGGIEH